MECINAASATFVLSTHDAFDRLVTEATGEQWNCTDFLDAMLQAENDHRSDRKTTRRIKVAKFALHPRFEDFDFTANRSITKTQIKDLYSLHWMSEARPVLLIGQAGVCKTFIARHRSARLRQRKVRDLYTVAFGTAWTPPRLVPRSTLKRCLP